MKVAVTGASGFIGGAVVRRLMGSSGTIEVRALASSVAGGDRTRERSPGIEIADLYGADGAVDPNAFKGCDVLLHCGWSTVPSTAERDPTGDLRANVEGGLRTIAAAAQAGVRRIVFLSSGGTVYGEAEYLPIDEDHAARPISAYGSAKRCLELYLGVGASQYGFEHLILRPSNVYGRLSAPDRPQGVIEHWMIRLMRGEPLEVWNDLSMMRDYLHIDDLVEPIITGLSAPIVQPVLNVGTGRGTTLAELIQLIGDLAGARPEIVVRPSSARTIPANVLDARLAERTLGFAARVTLEQGLQRTWDQIRSGHSSIGSTEQRPQS